MAAHCTLHHALGTIEVCPGAACPFWRDADAEAGCVLASISPEIEGRPAFAQYLLDLRTTLEHAPAPHEAWRRFYHLLNEEQASEDRPVVVES